MVGSQVKACAASASILIFAYTGVSVITDRSRLQRELTEQTAALEAAQETIRTLQSAGPHVIEDPAPPRRFFGAGGRARRRRQAAAEAFSEEAGGGIIASPPPAVSAFDAALLRSAAVISSPTCRAQWLTEQRAAAQQQPPSPHAAPRPYAGGDLEMPGVLEAALAARAPDHELIFLSVGDTRDHRRQYKDPSLRTISVDFLRNLLANLKKLRIGHYLILTTEPLCKRLQQDHCEYSCAWTSMWHDHPGLPQWNLKPGDMFLMWAQQWRYISQAMARGYRVLRSDTDVYLAEDPYPILRGPLFNRFEMVVQHDFFGARERPVCERRAPAPNGGVADGEVLPACGWRNPGLALLNIGLVYLRSTPGGGVFHVINDTWARFHERLSGPPSKPAHLRGAVDSQALIDQPFMRSVVNDMAVPDRRFSPPKRRADQWAVVPGTAAPTYAKGTTCALDDGALCGAVAAERQKTAFLVQTVRPSLRAAQSAGGQARAEFVALAPDWLFGRGCLTHVRAPLELLRSAGDPSSADGGCKAAPSMPGRVPLAPGPAAGLLVATHFVYSMALKRKRAFRAFGWDLGDARNRSHDGGGDCFRRAPHAMLLGHTFFDQTPSTKSVLCAMPQSDDAPACSCCRGLPSMTRKPVRGFRFESTAGYAFNSPQHFQSLEGCNDYQLFWD